VRERNVLLDGRLAAARRGRQTLAVGGERLPDLDRQRVLGQAREAHDSQAPGHLEELAMGAFFERLHPHRGQRGGVRNTQQRRHFTEASPTRMLV
jgi:hypothetical protein